MHGLAVLTRSILLLSTVASFIPQIRRLRARSDSTGISVVYAVLNLVVATEQVAFGVHLITIDPQVRDPGITHVPPRFSDWLNVLQFLVVWLGHGYIFIYILPHDPTRHVRKQVAVVAYVLFLFVSLIPLLIETTLPPITPGSNRYTDRSWFNALFGGFHSFYITPPVTVLAFVAFIPQAREVWRNSADGALSLTGLAVQAIIFTLVGVSWIFRLTIPRSNWESELSLAIHSWWVKVGWAAIYNLVFAFGQAVLFGIAWYRRSNPGESAGETQPLLS